MVEILKKDLTVDDLDILNKNIVRVGEAVEVIAHLDIQGIKAELESINSRLDDIDIKIDFLYREKA